MPPRGKDGKVLPPKSPKEQTGALYDPRLPPALHGLSEPQQRLLAVMYPPTEDRHEALRRFNALPADHPDRQKAWDDYEKASKATTARINQFEQRLKERRPDDPAPTANKLGPHNCADFFARLERSLADSDSD